jgi:hypothetical protein
MNPFIQDYATRLAAWKNCRMDINSAPSTQDKIDVCLKFWRLAPVQNPLLNWDNSESWPTAWELLNDNNYCSSSHSLGIALTLVWADPDLFKNVHLDLITDRSYSIQKIVVNWETWYLNHGHVDKIAKNTLQNVHTHERWKWAHKKWITLKPK